MGPGEPLNQRGGLYPVCAADRVKGIWLGASVQVPWRRSAAVQVVICTVVGTHGFDRTIVRGRPQSSSTNTSFPSIRT